MVGRARTEARLGTGDVVVVVRRWPPCDRSIANKRQCGGGVVHDGGGRPVIDGK